MHRPRSDLVAVSLLVVVACSGHPTEPTEALTFTYDFDHGPQEFIAGFADYPPAATSYELTSGHRALPRPLGPRSALFISEVNRSGDLFMFFKGQVNGRPANASYGVTVSVQIATETPSGCVGVGGAPGESVRIKAARARPSRYPSGTAPTYG